MTRPASPLLPPTRAMALCAALTGMVIAADWGAGYAWSVLVLYLVPIGLAAWTVGPLGGLVIVHLAAIGWTAANFRDPAHGEGLHQVWGVAWNGSMRYGVFLVVWLLLTQLRASLVVQRLTARQDPLTSLDNRAGFLEAAHAALQRCHARALGASLVVVDVDSLREINAKHGQNRGDLVLRQAARSVWEAAKPGELTARIGSDELVMLLPGVVGEAAAQRAAQLRDALGTLGARCGCEARCTVTLTLMDRAPLSTDELMTLVETGRRPGAAAVPAAA